MAIGLASLFGALVTSLRAQDQQLADGIRAVVNEIPITQLELERFVGPEKQFIYDRYSSRPTLFREKMIKLDEDGTESLIAREVILHDFRETIKIPESILDEFVEDRIKEQSHGDRIALTKQLELEGTTLEQLKQKIRDQLIVEEMRRKNVPEPIISPLKIENYYNDHHEDFKLEDQIKMRMIVLNKSSSDPDQVEQTRKRAGEILSQIKGGASFEELARTYSEGSLRSEGGETGWEDFSVVNKVLVDELNKLKPGQTSGVIEAPDGFYLILLEDRHLAHYRPLSEVRIQIRRTLAERETDRLQKQWIERLKRKTFVKFF